MNDMECERPVRLLHKPSDAELKRLKDLLRHETKPYLQEKATPFLNLMKKYRFRYNCGNGNSIMPKQIGIFEASKTHSKEAWVELLAIFYNEHNYTIIFEDMPKREVEVWREVLRNHFLIDKVVNKMMGKKCFTESRWYYDDNDLTEPLSHYFYSIYKKGDKEEGRISRSNSNFIFTGSLLQQMLLKEFFPDLININGLEALPNDSKLKIYNGENLIFSKLPVLASLYDSGVFPNDFAKLTGATVKKIQKVLSLPDFFQTYPDAKQPPLSTALMANYYLFFRAGKGRKGIPSSPEDLVKEIANDAYKANSFTLPVCLPYVKGIKKSLMRSSNFEFVITVALSIVKTHYEKGWLPLDSIIMKIRTFDTSADDRFMLITPFHIDDMELRNGYVNDCYIHLGNIIKQIAEPFVKSLMFMLSTFGVVEIAYREPADGDTSYYDGLQYVRLTELGKYVLGICKSYTPRLSDDNDPAFELDSQRLLIKVLRADTPFIPLLKDFAESITPSLYRVSYDSFLKGCTNATSVKQKVKLFRQYICSKQPAVWKQFFKEVEERINPFSSPDSQYTLMSLSPDDRELQRLVLTEPSIRKYVLKAENYMLLVKIDELKPFANALRKFGYLI